MLLSHHAAADETVTRLIVALYFIALHSLLLALGNLLADVGLDPLVGLVRLRFARNHLTDAADHGAEHDAVEDITLQLVGQWRNRADFLAEGRQRRLGQRACRGIVDSLG